MCLENGRLAAAAAAAAAAAMSSSSPQSSTSPPQNGSKSTSSAVSDANIRNFAPVARIMKTALPENAKIAKEAKECMQECVSEFISFITSEGGFNVGFARQLLMLSCQLPKSASRRSARRSTARTSSSP